MCCLPADLSAGSRVHLVTFPIQSVLSQRLTPVLTSDDQQETQHDATQILGLKISVTKHSR